MIIETVSEDAQRSLSLSKGSISFGLWLLIFELGLVSVWAGFARWSRSRVFVEPIPKTTSIGSPSGAGRTDFDSENVGKGVCND